MDGDRIERFWEITCTMTPLLYFGLVMVISLLALSLLSIALAPQNNAATAINGVNVVLSVALLGVLLAMIRKCRNVYN